MAKREFDYTEISNLYNQMNTITGDKSDPTSIAGILDKINLDYTDVVHGVVSEDEMALFGELGQQMLLNWENTSANFPNFVENFDAWSSLVAQAAGDYSRFEQEVQGIRTSNPLGWASGGMQDSFITSSVYANALSEQEIADLAAQSKFYELTGSTYIDTGMVSYLKKADIWEGVELALDVATIVSGGFSVSKYFRAATSLTTVGNARSVTNAAGEVFDIAKPSSITALRKSLEGTKGLGKAKEFFKILFSKDNAGNFRALTTSTTDAAGARNVLILSKFANSPLAGYAATGYMGIKGTSMVVDKIFGTAPEQTGTGFYTHATGDVVNIGGTDYEFLGQSSSGTNIYSDISGNLVYDTGNNTVSPVMFDNNGTMSSLNVNDLTEDTELFVGTDNIGKSKDLLFTVVDDGFDVDGYYDTINTNMENFEG